MKLQCACGAKYAFDITPEMAANPVRFVCPACGLDSSDYVNQLVREELAAPAADQPLPDTPAPSIAGVPPPAARLRISHGEKPAAAEPGPAMPASSKFCARHRERGTEKCAVCGKPICPKCLTLFGYFCSPLCQGRAEAENLQVPVYAGRKDVIEAVFWRKAGLIFSALGAAVILALGAWTWYAWFGAVPHLYYSVRFENTDRAYAGQTQLTDKDQLVYLHGGTLARCDLAAKKQVWTQELITRPQIDAVIKGEYEAEARLNEANSGGYTHHRTGEDIERSARQSLQAELALRVSGHNIWVARGNRLAHYDWDTGKVLREISLPEGGGELVGSGDELLLVGVQSVTHISLASGDARVEPFDPPGSPSPAAAPNSPGGGLAGAANSRPLDPATIEAQVQNLKTPGRVALPALLANAQHQQQLEAALKDDVPRPRLKKSPPAPAGRDNFQLVPGATGFVQLSTRMLEEHLVTRTAMKAPPKNPALDGELNGTKATEAANEILNEMQRSRGGDSVTEDESRYQVTLHLPGTGSTADWTGEVVGPPQLFALKTVNVIAAGKTIIVLDQANKKLWQAALTYPIAAGGGGFFREESRFGEGPCVEHGGSLYVFDQAVLSAFDLTTGNARWRLPSVGVVGLFFDDHGDVYVNTTTSNPDDIKYSRQIDINRETKAVLFKIEPQTGKTLWTLKTGGYIAYLSGKFIYALESFDPNPTDEEAVNDMAADLQKPPFLHLVRIRPANGHIMWDYYDRNRCPIDVRFHANSIELLFKREVQVLRYLTF